ncbi:hypothetical protein [Oxynema aestuarii]|nr:hypothetical protein [Oxynema aestuarii]
MLGKLLESVFCFDRVYGCDRWQRQNLRWDVSEQRSPSRGS